MYTGSNAFLEQIYYGSRYDNPDARAFAHGWMPLNIERRHISLFFHRKYTHTGSQRKRRVSRYWVTCLAQSTLSRMCTAGILFFLFFLSTLKIDRHFKRGGSMRKNRAFFYYRIVFSYNELFSLSSRLRRIKMPYVKSFTINIFWNWVESDFISRRYLFWYHGDIFSDISLMTRYLADWKLARENEAKPKL